MKHRITSRIAALAVMSAGSLLAIQSAVTAPLDIRNVPIFLDQTVAPINMLVVGRDHKLYYEAYNDASDLNGDGILDVGFKPEITYFGYFDSGTCYVYGTVLANIFTPSGPAGTANTCSGKWSGNWLNYVTTARIDALRKVLYGGRRITDTATQTVLERTHIPQDAHSWAKSYDSVALNGYNITQYTPLSIPNSGKRHLFANTTLADDLSQLPRMRYAANTTAQPWNWVSKERPVAGAAANDGHTLVINDYVVRVQVCVDGADFISGTVDGDSSCRKYPNGGFKPVGLLQEYGEANTMLFGMITGSYQKNTDGGVLRKAVGSFTNEVNASTGQFLGTDPGIIKTLDGLKTVGFTASGYNYDDNCGWIDNGPITSGKCRMWGNPVGEMMYEALRYFAGKGAPTAAFDIATSGNADATLGLSRATWNNPYGSGAASCAKPFMTVVSDINPSYDTDQVPGTAFGSFSGDLTGLDANARGQAIWTGEGWGSKSHFIGQSGSAANGSPSPKAVSSLGNIRGLAPEEPTKLGGYYSASVAYHGATTDISTATGSQKVQTFAVALASPLPRIEIPVAGKTVTLVPFAKTVNPSSGRAEGAFQPTNQIVDFYVEYIAPDGKSGVFQVNFEDVEQGADHDMDAITRYEYQVQADNKVKITLTSTYAAGGYIQHMGYVISGTTADGTYLEVRDVDTGASSDPDYFLDTPPGKSPGSGWNDGAPLPTTANRTFTPGSTAAATILQDPLWFAAKWGGFLDGNGNGLPDLGPEWDADGNGDPDNYFLVTNALTLKEKLGKAFSGILERSGSASSAAINASVIREDTRVFSSSFKSLIWSGDVTAQSITKEGSIGETQWSAASVLPAWNARKIATLSGGVGVPFQWDSLNASKRAALGADNDAMRQARLQWVRGDRAQEQRNGGSLRNRDPLSVLGDFTYSAPAYVGKPTGRHSDSLESAAYSSFVSTRATRQGIVYIGGNDGMLHAFNSTTGVEEWAFIPDAVFVRLPALTAPSYQHQFMVDGAPAVGDAFWDSSWKTVLVTGLGRGGQGLFAMDITNPVAASEAAVASKYLWQFTSSNDADMGLTLGKPVVTRMANGKWAVVIGNGYNNTQADGTASTTGNAVLYILDAKTGALLRKIDTGVGMAADPTGAGRPNGLASVAVVDVDRDSTADFAYAGDLFGNLWKFDLRDAAAANWKVAYQVSGSPAPLYVAKDSLGNRQPITTRPQVSRAGNGADLMIHFGTGKFLEPGDRTLANLKTQTFYALLDKNLLTTADLIADRTLLQSQSIMVETQVTMEGKTSGIRVTSDNSIGGKRGWYMDFLSPGNVFRGEMLVTDPVLRGDSVVFSTLVPNPDPCAYGGESNIMMINAASGSRLKSSFDLNGDGKINSEDYYETEDGELATSSSIKYEDGIATRPVVVTDGAIDLLLTMGSGDDDGIGGCGAGRICGQRVFAQPGFYGRQSWRQMRTEGAE
jgi:type IV pilus assembly protein PilY1